MEGQNVVKEIQMKEGVKNTMKRENGITLIALIITIIILIILAAVSARAVYEMGIVNHAVNGTQKYSEEAVKENKMLDSTVTFIDDAVAKVKEIQDGNTAPTEKQLLEEYFSAGPEEFWDSTNHCYKDVPGINVDSSEIQEINYWEEDGNSYHVIRYKSCFYNLLIDDGNIRS